MSSKTQKTKKRRRTRKNALGRDAKKARAKEGTPPFPVGPSQGRARQRREEERLSVARQPPRLLDCPHRLDRVSSVVRAPGP